MRAEPGKASSAAFALGEHGDGDAVGQQFVGMTQGCPVQLVPVDRESAEGTYEIADDGDVEKLFLGHEQERSGYAYGKKGRVRIT
jgi:hypothetical protein